MIAMSKDSYNIRFERVRVAFETRDVSSFTDAELSDFTDTLCDGGLRNDEHQTRAILRILAMSHVQMKGHITKLDAANGKTQRWFMALAIASLTASGVSIVQNLIQKSVDVPVLKDFRPTVQSDIQGHDVAKTIPSPH
jgi:hypothetical protein